MVTCMNLIAAVSWRKALNISCDRKEGSASHILSDLRLCWVGECAVLEVGVTGSLFLKHKTTFEEVVAFDIDIVGVCGC